jgi:hypothetical protein
LLTFPFLALVVQAPLTTSMEVIRHAGWKKWSSAGKDDLWSANYSVASHDELHLLARRGKGGNSFPWVEDVILSKSEVLKRNVGEDKYHRVPFLISLMGEGMPRRAEHVLLARTMENAKNAATKTTLKLVNSATISARMVFSSILTDF